MLHALCWGHNNTMFVCLKTLARLMEKYIECETAVLLKTSYSICYA